MAGHPAFRFTLHLNQAQADLDGSVDFGQSATVDHTQTLDQPLPGGFPLSRE